MANVTILMPAYNASKYLKQSIDSILNQTYPNFILLIINDGSIDDTEKIALSYNDKRIQYVKNEQNMGLVNTLNKGIDLTETEFFARMDADDIAYPQRIEEQLNYLNTHPEIGVCGTLYEYFGSETGVSSMHLNNDDIVANLLFSNGICHPSVIIRTGLLKKNNIRFGVDFDYNDGYGHKLLELEDHALWHKLKSVTKFTNLNSVLLKYRKEGQNLSVQNKEAIMKRRQKFIRFCLSELGITVSDRALELHCSFSAMKNSISKEDVNILRNHFNNILQANKTKQVYPVKALENIVEKQWKRFFYLLPSLGLPYVLEYWRASKSIKFDQAVHTLKRIIKN